MDLKQQDDLREMVNSLSWDFVLHEFGPLLTGVTTDYVDYCARLKICRKFLSWL